MAKRKKRKPDMRRIRPSACYTVNQLAKAIDRDPATIRRWIRGGLPTLDDRRPPMIDGAIAKKWLCDKWAKRKSPSKPNEAYCFKCHKARPFLDGSFGIWQHTGKALTMSGQCVVCGRRMNKFVSAKAVAFLERTNGHKRGNSAA